MLAIKNATLVMRDHYIPNAVILLEDGKIDYMLNRLERALRLFAVTKR